jgi:multiple sugar transport system permease protein
MSNADANIRSEENVKSAVAAQRKKKIVPWIAIGPAFIFLLLVTLYPFVYTIFTSLFEWYLPSPQQVFVGLKNYGHIFSSGEFLPALWRTVYFTMGCLGLEHLLGLIFALLLANIGKLRGFFTAAFMIPMMLPPVVSALIWKLMYRPSTGVINYVLASMHLPTQVWLHGKNLVIPSIILVDVWQWTPFVMLVLLGGITSISEDLFEAAEIDGASFQQKTLHVILPLLKPFFIVTFLLRFIYVFTTFDIIMSLTGGGPGRGSATIYFMGYLTSFEYLQMGRGATWNIIIFIMVFITSLFLVNRLFKKEG